MTEEGAAALKEDPVGDRITALAKVGGRLRVKVGYRGHPDSPYESNTWFWFDELTDTDRHDWLRVFRAHEKRTRPKRGEGRSKSVGAAKPRGRKKGKPDEPEMSSPELKAIQSKLAGGTKSRPGPGGK